MYNLSKQSKFMTIPIQLTNQEQVQALLLEGGNSKHFSQSASKINKWVIFGGILLVIAIVGFTTVYLISTRRIILPVSMGNVKKISDAIYGVASLSLLGAWTSTLKKDERTYTEAITGNDEESWLSSISLTPPLVEQPPLEPLNLTEEIKNVRGIRNPGTNCWLNSLMQMILCLAIDKINAIGDIHPSINRFIRDYIANKGNPSKLNTTAIRQYLGQHIPDIKNPATSYKDAHEPFVFLLNEIRKTPVLEGLKLQITQEFDHRPEDPTEEEVDNNGMIDVCLPEKSKPVALVELLNIFNRNDQPQAITDDSGKKYNKTSESNFLSTAPQDLILNIKRYSHSITTFLGIKFPSTVLRKDAIKLTGNLALEEKYFLDKVTANYELTSFIINLNQAHYISYIKKDGKWFQANDATITQVSDEDALTAAEQAYIIHYKKV